MTTCFPCTLYQGGEPTATVDGIRIQQLLLKVLSGGPDAEAEMLAELADCPGCTLRIAARLLCVYTQLIANNYGSVEAAKQALDIDIAQALNNLPDEYP